MGVDGYYLNSLRAWIDRLRDEHRKLMARHARLERQGHPSTYGQGKLIDLNARMIELVDSALTEAILDRHAERPAGNAER